jgi:hypothetical protein
VGSTFLQSPQGHAEHLLDEARKAFLVFRRDVDDGAARDRPPSVSDKDRALNVTVEIQHAIEVYEVSSREVEICLHLKSMFREVPDMAIRHLAVPLETARALDEDPILLTVLIHESLVGVWTIVGSGDVPLIAEWWTDGKGSSAAIGRGRRSNRWMFMRMKKIIKGKALVVAR